MGHSLTRRVHPQSAFARMPPPTPRYPRGLCAPAAVGVAAPAVVRAPPAVAAAAPVVVAAPVAIAAAAPVAVVTPPVAIPTAAAASVAVATTAATTAAAPVAVATTIAAAAASSVPTSAAAEGAKAAVAAACTKDRTRQPLPAIHHPRASMLHPLAATRDFELLKPFPASECTPQGLAHGLGVLLQLWWNLVW